MSRVPPSHYKRPSYGLNRRTAVTVVSQQNPEEDGLVSVPLRAEPTLAWADLCNRCSAEMESRVRSPGEIREQWDSLSLSLPFSPRCVVRSDPLHCIYILCILRLLCLLETVRADGMLSGHGPH